MSEYTYTLTEPRLQRLVSETIMVGKFYCSAVLHPCNYPELLNIESLNGISGLIVACDIRYKQSYLFHDSQMQRVTAYNITNMEKSNVK